MIRFGIFAFVYLLATAGHACAQGAAVREAGEVVLRSLSSYFGKASAKEVGEQLAEYGGEAAVRQLAQKAAAKVVRKRSSELLHSPESMGLRRSEVLGKPIKSFRC